MYQVLTWSITYSMWRVEKGWMVGEEKNLKIYGEPEKHWAQHYGGVCFRVL